MGCIVGKIFDIKRFAVHDGPGIRTTLYLKGCPLSCRWCHNPEGIAFKSEIGFLNRLCVNCGACVYACPQGAQELKDGIRYFDRKKCTLCGECVKACLYDALVYYGKEITAKEAAELLLEDKDFYYNSGGGITLSGGEPLIQSSFASEVLRLCRECEIDTAVDTSGAVKWSEFEKVLPFTSRFLYDFKHFNREQHIKWTGFSNELPMSNLTRLDESDVPVEVRMPIVPGVNDNYEAIMGAADFLDKRTCVKIIRLLPFHDFARSKYEQVGLEDTIPHVNLMNNEELGKIAEIMKGIRPRIIIASGL